MSRRTITMFSAALIAFLGLAGCAPPKASTTFLRSVDLVEMTDRMAQSFVATPAVSARSPSSVPRWIISIDKVVNHTNQIIPDGEKWAYVGRLRALLAQSGVATERNIVWIVPPERWPEIARELGALGEPPDLRMSPTHLLSAEFAALTNTSGSGRSDAYVCAFQLVDLKSGSLVWEDSWEVKRATIGKTYD